MELRTAIHTRGVKMCWNQWPEKGTCISDILINGHNANVCLLDSLGVRREMQLNPFFLSQEERKKNMEIVCAASSPLDLVLQQVSKLEGSHHQLMAKANQQSKWAASQPKVVIHSSLEYVTRIHLRLKRLTWKDRHWQMELDLVQLGSKSVRGHEPIPRIFQYLHDVNHRNNITNVVAILCYPDSLKRGQLISPEASLKRIQKLPLHIELVKMVGGKMVLVGSNRLMGFEGLCW